MPLKDICPRIRAVISVHKQARSFFFCLFVFQKSRFRLDDPGGPYNDWPN